MHTGNKTTQQVDITQRNGINLHVVGGKIKNLRPVLIESSNNVRFYSLIGGHFGAKFKNCKLEKNFVFFLIKHYNMLKKLIFFLKK